MPKLICCCPSRARPDRIQEMLNSFLGTRTEGLTKMVVSVNEEDPKIEEYRKVIKAFEGLSIHFIVSKCRYMVEALNYIATEAEPGADYYQNICDDHIYLMEGWDRLMLEPLEKNKGWGIAYVLDKDDPTENPTAPVFSGKIIRALGYFYFPQYRQWGEEPYIAELGITGYFFLGRNLIEHRCPQFGKAKRDEIHEFVYSAEEHQHSRDAYVAWHQSNDIEKVREAMEKEGAELHPLDQGIIETIIKVSG